MFGASGRNHHSLLVPFDHKFTYFYVFGGSGAAVSGDFDRGRSKLMICGHFGVLWDDWSPCLGQPADIVTDYSSLFTINLLICTFLAASGQQSVEILNAADLN